MVAAVIATQLTDHAVRYKYLKIGGTDVLNKYSGSAYGYSVRRETIDLTEEGPGGVSSLHFTIADPLVQVTLVDGQDVEFWDITRNRPLFLGFIQTFEINPTAVGREIAVTCIGIECLLDWLIVPNLTILAGTRLSAAIQSAYYNSSGMGWPLRAFTQPYGSEDYGHQDTPIAAITDGSLQYDVVFEGQSLRQACTDLIVASDTWVTGAAGGYVTIDFYSGLRLMNGNAAGVEGILTMSPQADMDSMSIFDGAAASYPYLTSDNVKFRLDSGGVVRGVYVKGANAAGSGLVSDGTGIPGPIQYISDDTSTTAAIRNAIALDYLGGFSQATRATEAFSPIPTANLDAFNYRPGSYVFKHVDSQVMGATTIFSLFRIHKRFDAYDMEHWTVDYGGNAPSALKQTRRLTRSTRS